MVANKLCQSTNATTCDVVPDGLLNYSLGPYIGKLCPFDAGVSSKENDSIKELRIRDEGY